MKFKQSKLHLDLKTIVASYNLCSLLEARRRVLTQLKTKVSNLSKQQAIFLIFDSTPMTSHC